MSKFDDFTDFSEVENLFLQCQDEYIDAKKEANQHIESTLNTLLENFDDCYQEYEKKKSELTQELQRETEKQLSQIKYVEKVKLLEEIDKKIFIENKDVDTGEITVIHEAASEKMLIQGTTIWFSLIAEIDQHFLKATTINRSKLSFQEQLDDYSTYFPFYHVAIDLLKIPNTYVSKEYQLSHQALKKSSDTNNEFDDELYLLIMLSWTKVINIISNTKTLSNRLIELYPIKYFCDLSNESKSTKRVNEISEIVTNYQNCLKHYMNPNDEKSTNTLRIENTAKEILFWAAQRGEKLEIVWDGNDKNTQYIPVLAFIFAARILKEFLIKIDKGKSISTNTSIGVWKSLKTKFEQDKTRWIRVEKFFFHKQKPSTKKIDNFEKIMDNFTNGNFFKIEIELAESNAYLIEKGMTACP